MREINPRVRKEYLERINLVLDYVRKHLDEPLSLDDLADVASFSRYHFHRIFSAMVGETVGDYIQRLRLERSAVMLGNPLISITEIALECGFSSSASFARAFRRHFGVSASEFRSNYSKIKGKNGKANGNIGEDSTSSLGYDMQAFSQNINLNQEEMEMKVEIKTLPNYHVAYIRNMGYNEKIEPTWRRLEKWVRAHDLLNDSTVSIGVSYDDESITPPDKCRYEACMTVPETTKPDGEVGINDLPGGKFVLYRLEGDFKDIQKIIKQGFKDVFRNWLPASGFQPDDKPCYELYHDPGEKGKFSADLAIPVKPL